MPRSIMCKLTILHPVIKLWTLQPLLSEIVKIYEPYNFNFQILIKTTFWRRYRSHKKEDEFFFRCAWAEFSQLIISCFLFDRANLKTAPRHHMHIVIKLTNWSTWPNWVSFYVPSAKSGSYRRVVFFFRENYPIRYYSNY